MRVKKALLPIGVALTLLMAGCVVAPANRPYHNEPVRVAPPPPRVERVGPPPVAGQIWIDGYWNWSGGRYDWVSGRWDQPRPGQRWVPHRWERDGDSWRQQGGRWEAHDNRRDDRWERATPPPRDNRPAQPDYRQDQRDDGRYGRPEQRDDRRDQRDYRQDNRNDGRNNQDYRRENRNDGRDNQNYRRDDRNDGRDKNKNKDWKDNRRD